MVTHCNFVIFQSLNKLSISYFLRFYASYYLYTYIVIRTDVQNQFAINSSLYYHQYHPMLFHRIENLTN